jgi:hypothetical protein
VGGARRGGGNFGLSRSPFDSVAWGELAQGKLHGARIVAGRAFFEGQKRKRLGAGRAGVLSTFVLEMGGTPLGDKFFVVWNQIGGLFY